MGRIIIPSFNQGFARNASECESNARNLWDGKVAHWPIMLGFTGNKVFDVGPEKSRGTLNGMDVSTDWSRNNEGMSVLGFDGTDEFVDCGIVKGVNDLVTGFSVVGIAKTTNDLDNSYRITGQKSGSAWSFGRKGLNLRFTISGGDDLTTTVAPASNNTWHQWGLVFDKDQDAHFYLDGKFIETIVGAASPTPLAAAWLIGARGVSGTDDEWIGSIADVKIYNRELNPSEFMQLYLDPWADLRLKRLIISTVTSVSVTVTPTALPITTTLPAPVIIGDTTVIPSTLTVTATLLAPTIITDVIITPSVLSVTATLLAPVVVSDATVTPSVLSITAALPVSTVATTQTVTPSVLSVTAALLAPTIVIDTVVAPSPISITTTLLSPTIITDVTVTPSAQAITAALLAPAVVIGELVAPAALPITAALLAPTVVIDATITPSVQAITATSLSPVVVINETVTPSALSITTTLLAPNIIGDVTITPSTQTITATLLAPTVVIDETVTPSTIAIAASILAPSINIGITVTPSPVTITAALLAPVINTGSIVNITVTPSVLPVTASLLSHIFKPDMTVLPSVLSMSVSILTPADITDNKTACMNTGTLAVTQYVNFNYNSYTKFNGQYIALNKTGIYELGGNDDDGTNIIASFKTGTIDTYGEHINRLRDAYVSFRSDGDILLKTVGDEINERTYAINNSTANTIHERRIKFQRGIKDRYFSFELSNDSGSSMDVDKLKVAMEPIKKRR